MRKIETREKSSISNTNVLKCDIEFHKEILNLSITLVVTEYTEFIYTEYNFSYKNIIGASNQSYC